LSCRTKIKKKKEIKAVRRCRLALYCTKIKEEKRGFGGTGEPPFAVQYEEKRGNKEFRRYR